MALKHNSLASLFSAIADAIRAKTGGSSQIVADDFPDEIAAISGGGGSSGIVYVMDEPDDSGSSEILEEYIPEEVIAAVDFEEFDWDAWQYLGYAVDAPIEIGATYKVSFNGSEYTLTGQRNFDGAPALGDVDFSFSTYPFCIYTHQDFGTWYWTLMVLGQPNRAQTVEVYKVTQRAGHGGIVRHLITDGATITDTIDEHGGIVRNVTGAEVRLQVKRVTPGATEQVITADAGFGALGKVIVEAGGDGALNVTISGTVGDFNGEPQAGATLDKTYEEIFDAVDNGVPVTIQGKTIVYGEPARWNYIIKRLYFYDSTYRIQLKDPDNMYNSGFTFASSTPTGTLTLMT